MSRSGVLIIRHDHAPLVSPLSSGNLARSGRVAGSGTISMDSDLAYHFACRVGGRSLAMCALLEEAILGNLRKPFCDRKPAEISP
jgi:hypothetical protein